MTTLSAPTELQQAQAALDAGQFAQALALAQPLADAPQPIIFIAALQIMGVALMRLGKLQDAEDLLRRVLEWAPRNAKARVNLAQVQVDRGQAAAAVQTLDQALALDPQLVEAHFSRGLALMSLGQAEAAVPSFAHAARLAPDLPRALYNQAGALHQLGRNSEAHALASQVTARWPDYAEGWNLLGITWNVQRRYQQACDAYNQALRCNPRLIDAWCNMAQALLLLGRHEQARAAAEHAVQLAPDNVPVLHLMCQVLGVGGDQEAADPWFEKIHQIDPQDARALLYLSGRDVRQCNWTGIEARLPALRRLIGQGRVAGLRPFWQLSLPLTLAELRDATVQSCAFDFASLQRLGAREGWGSAAGRPRPPKLRIGYFSANFDDHAMMHQMAGFFEANDKTRFETAGICLGRHGQHPDGLMRQRVKRSFDRFETAGDLDDDQLVALARKLDLHIAVDLNGHTGGARMPIFAARVAPIQVHYLGYPGTLGMPGDIDYLVADRVLIPESSRPFYTEKIIELPDSYQVNDRKREIAQAAPSRQELGLPENAFVFCCFNNNYKITRQVFELWMQLLREQPGSVLWLLADNDAVSGNLRQAARDAGIDPGRIIFAARARPPQHLARQTQADLFLDTWPYNAHGTASFALWAGLPVLTCAGATFASRVGASLLTACNLPELITATPQDYLSRAKELAHDPEQLETIRRKLQDTRLTVPLFDTARFTRHMETAYDLVWERFASGLPPDHITVPPLA